MPPSFLDTTIVVDLAGGNSASRSLAFVSANQPSHMAQYALRELLTGRVRNICDAHNVVLGAENIGDALLALANLPAVEGRKKQAKLQDVAQGLKAAFDVDPNGPRNSLKRQLLQDLSSRAGRMWRNAQHLTGVTTVQQLSCFNATGKLARGQGGELRGPNNSFNCCKDERCAAAAYINDDPAALKKMIDALHPSKLGEEAKTKNENNQRRKALKELQDKGPKEFHKRFCRALGDAYFAAMCPPGSVVVTTNLADFEPLCAALGKRVQKP